MSDIKLYRVNGKHAEEFSARATDLEKSLQNLIEKNLEVLLGMKFLSTEYSTGKTHSGRIDTLALDENSCPVIIEYKRHSSENVINQGLFYLDWLMDHKAEFELLVMQVLGKNVSNTIDWSAPRLVCIAADFSRYDEHAVQQMNRNIELIRYRMFDENLLLFELVNSVSEKNVIGLKNKKIIDPERTAEKSLSEMSKNVRELFDELESYLFSLGDDVQRKDLKRYVVYKRIRNFVCVVIQKGKLTLHVSLDPDKVNLEEGFTRDMRGVGHWGTGDLAIFINSPSDLEKAKPLLKRSYEGG